LFILLVTHTCTRAPVRSAHCGPHLSSIQAAVTTGMIYADNVYINMQKYIFVLESSFQSQIGLTFERKQKPNQPIYLWFIRAETKQTSYVDNGPFCDWPMLGTRWARLVYLSCIAKPAHTLLQFSTDVFCSSLHNF